MKIEKVGAKGGPTPEDLPPGSMKAEFTLSIYFEPQSINDLPTSTASAGN
jgi:hypothetical protein